CFVLVLSWSRAVYARFALDQTLESFLRGHVEAFTTLTGVPRVILYDNLRSVVLERVGDHIRFHPRLLDLAGHYHFAPQPCAVARGNEKGRVERMIGFLRGSFFAARAFTSLEDPAHVAALVREKRRARELRGRDRLRQSCPQADAFLEALAGRGEPLAPQTVALLRLLDQYGAPALDAALAAALHRGAVHAASVAHLLDRRARARHT